MTHGRLMCVAVAALLVAMLVAEAGAIGYRELKLDTLAFMRDAQALYARFGFVGCSPYYHNPLPDTVYMTRAL